MAEKPTGGQLLPQVSSLDLQDHQNVARQFLLLLRSFPNVVLPVLFLAKGLVG